MAGTAMFKANLEESLHSWKKVMEEQREFVIFIFDIWSEGNGILG